MSSSLAYTVPAAAATLAYLNARWSFPNDWRIISSIAKGKILVRRRERNERLNGFYLLEEHANNPKVTDCEFLVFGSQSWSFQQVYDMALRYAGWLHTAHSVSAGEIIAVDFMNSPEFIFLTFALWSLGATPAFINYNLTGAPLIHCVRTSTARLLIVDPSVRSAITPEVNSALSSPTFLASPSNPNATSTKIAFLSTPFSTTSLPYFPPYRAPDSARTIADPSRTPAVLIYTSGTTGMPKPAIFAWARYNSGIVFVSSWLGLRPTTNSSSGDRFYTSMPLYHSSAFVLGFSIALVTPCTLILSPKFSTTRFWAEVRASRATVIQYVGETLRYLLSAPPSPLDTSHSVRLAFGNGLRPDIWEPFRTRFGIQSIGEFYAATEGTSGSWNYSSNTFASGAIGRNGAIGYLFLSNELAVVRLNHETQLPYRDPKTGFCIRVARGSPGELLYALDASDPSKKFQGYFNNPSATQSKILRDVFRKGDAWFRTGDLVRWDTDGRWFFADRIGDSFRWKAENVATAEVAQVLGTHPRVREANVYGVMLPRHDGRAGCAAVLLDDPTVGDRPGDEVWGSLAEHAMKELPRYAVPVFVRCVREVKATGNNKQQKVGLRGEGVDPNMVEKSATGDRVYWLRSGRYVPFERSDWERIVGGAVKL